tara:strand:- start:137 stop:697 length:561 start_codon:yes stop_codon:yes gene_type:complete
MVKSILKEISNNFEKLSESHSKIEEASNLIIQSLTNGGKIMFCGNGGSAADSQHLATELIGRYRNDRDPIAAIALTTDTSLITAISNDYSFEEIFSRQINGLGNSGDILYAISTSGISKNIIRAITTANEKNIKIVGVTGSTGGEMEGICDVLIKVPSNRPDRIQEMHIAIGQIICEKIENYFLLK